MGKKQAEEQEGKKPHVTKSKSTVGKNMKDLEDSKSPPSLRNIDQGKSRFIKKKKRLILK